jgi:hypothetical protein
MMNTKAERAVEQMNAGMAPKRLALVGLVLVLGLAATGCTSLNDEAFEEPPADTLFDEESCRGIEPVGAQLSCLEDYKRTGSAQPRR